jgi:WD40 repeat protein
MPEDNFIADRFIPVRDPMRSDVYGSPLDHISSPEPKTPHAELLMDELADPEKRVLVFSPLKKQKLTQAKAAYKQPAFSFKRSRILDAFGMLNDFYSNTLTWSKQLIITLNAEEEGIHKSRIYLTSLPTEESTSLTIKESLPFPACAHAVLSLNDKTIVSGWSDGVIRLTNTQTTASYPYVREIETGSTTIYSLTATSPNTFIAGNKTGHLSHFDIRTREGMTHQITAHAPAQISGLAYNQAHSIASGSNDNTVKLWDIRNLNGGEIKINTTHTAGIKALAFSPNSSHTLISGAGTKCKKLCQWNTQTNALCIEDTSGQITGIQYLQNPEYIVSSHGYCDSNENLKLWKLSPFGFLKITEIAVNPGADANTNRVVSLAKEPNTDRLALLSSTETLRFFTVVSDKTKKEKLMLTAPSPLVPSDSSALR